MALTDDEVALVEAATAVIRKYGAAPRHTVGAALRTADGNVFTAVNVFAQGGGACAELVALGAAISAGHQDFAAIVAVGDTDRGVVRPCGVCRQLLLDYAPDISVIMPGIDGKHTASPHMLLPNAEQSWFAP